ncbi:MAG: chemotaxis protein CheW [Myxococcota bacterium]
MNLEKYRALFIDEATDHLAEMSRAVVELEKCAGTPDAAEPIATLFRMAHSIKGMAASLSYEAVAELAHGLEGWMEPLRGRTGIPVGAVPLLLEIVAALETMVGVVSSCEEAPAPRPDLLALLETPGTVPAGYLQGDPEKKAQASSRPPLPRTVRVRAEAVDRFLAAVGELIQRHARLVALHRASPFWTYHREFGDGLEGMAQVVRELRERALEIRTTPIQRILERLPPMAAELAHALGKRVRVELTGEEVEVDRAVLDHLDGPLLHLVRNSIDHGIEGPVERVQAGKPETGTIRIEAHQEGARVRVTLEDDGAGIDVERLRRLAVDRGLLVQAVAEDLPPERIVELVFEPGLTTRSAVTEVSGRGVGLDAVKRGIESLGGEVRVRSTPGQGSRFEIEVPSVVALQRVLVVGIGDERLALPAANVEAVVRVAEGGIEGIGGDAFFEWRGEPLPLLDLGKRLGVSSSVPEDEGAIAVVETQGFRLGLRIDRATSHLEVFVREVPPPLDSSPILAGVAILPDGDPVFLLEVAQVVEKLL